MGFWQQREKVWRERRGLPPPEERSASPVSSVKEPAEWLLNALGSPIKSGQSVNHVTAQKVTAVARCVGILSESIAKLPLGVVRKTGKGTDPEPDHYLTPLLSDSPNLAQDAFQFREHGQSTILLRGNQVCRVWRDSQYRVEAIDPLPQAEVEIRENLPGERLRAFYYHRGVQLMPGEYLHLRGGGAHPLIGTSIISLAREAIGLALATEEHGARLFSNGVQPSGVFQSDGNLTDEQYQRFKKMVEDRYVGGANHWRPLLLEGGAKWQSVSMTSEDSQFLESRKFQVEDISRAFGVPLFMLNSTEKSTSWGSGMESLKKAFLSFTLQPWIRRWEYALDRQLLTASERKAGFQIAFDTREYETPTFKELVEAINVARGCGLMTANEGREWLNLNQIPDNTGGLHHIPLNWGVLGAAPVTKQEDVEV